MEECFVELLDKQEIDEEIVVLPDMPEKTPYEQEESVEMKTCKMSLPNWFKAKESVHADEKELEVPEINKVEIKRLPREMKSEKPIELEKSKIHPKWKKVLTSRAVKRVNLTGLGKGKICRPPPKTPDRENSLNFRHETKKGRVRPYKNKKESQEAQKIDRKLNCRPPPKLPYILNANGEVIGILENIVPKNRPPPKPLPKNLNLSQESVNLRQEDNTLNISYISGPGKNPLKKAQNKEYPPINQLIFIYFRTNNSHRK